MQSGLVHAPFSAEQKAGPLDVFPLLGCEIEIQPKTKNIAPFQQRMHFKSFQKPYFLMKSSW